MLRGLANLLSVRQKTRQDVNDLEGAVNFLRKFDASEISGIKGVVSEYGGLEVETCNGLSVEDAARKLQEFDKSIPSHPQYDVFIYRKGDCNTAEIRATYPGNCHSMAIEKKMRLKITFVPSGEDL